MARGGKREGAGRPFGTTKDKTVPYYRRVKPEWVAVLDDKLEKLKAAEKEIKMEDTLEKEFKNCHTVGELEKVALQEFGCGELGDVVEYNWERGLAKKGFFFHDIDSEESDRVWEESEEHLYWSVWFDFVNEELAKKLLANAESADDIRDIEIANIDFSRVTSDN